MVNLLFDEDGKLLTTAGAIRALYDPVCGTGHTRIRAAVGVGSRPITPETPPPDPPYPLTGGTSRD